MDEEMMDLDDTVESDGDEFVIASAGQTLDGCSLGHYQLRSGRNIVRPAARSFSQEPDDGSAPDATGHGVRRRKPSRKQARVVIEDERQRQIREAIANGSYLIQVPQHSGNPFSAVENLPEHLQRLTRELVLPALYSQTPGLIFPTLYEPGPFTNAEVVDDLVGALEAYQIALARKGTVILSSEACELVRSFTRSVLRSYLRTKRRMQISFGDDELWHVMANSFHGKLLKRWLRGTVVKTLKDDNAGKSGRIIRKAFKEAIEAPGKHPQIDQAIGNALELGQPHYGHAVTLRALVQHFETARTRYLSSINSSTRPVSIEYNRMKVASPGSESTPLWRFGAFPERRDVDSSDEENESLQDSGSEADIEGDIQVEGELLFGKDRALIKVLDKWMELAKHGKRQDSIDADMLSALTLHGGVQN